MRKTTGINTMLEDCDGMVSSKRVITLLAFILCSIAFMVDTFTTKDVKPELFDAMIYLVIAGLGFTASEKFAERRRYRGRDSHDSNGTDTYNA